MSGTKIEWTDETWNPTVGCTRLSEGCRFCYAFDLHDRRHQAYQQGKLQQVPQYARPFREMQLLPDRLEQPLRWTRSRRIFVNSLSDLFHQDVPEAFLDQVFAVMFVAAEREVGAHTFQLLTKRPERMREYLLAPERRRRIADALPAHLKDRDLWHGRIAMGHGPLVSSRIWLGTSVEDQQSADTRIPALLGTPATLRFLSCEPLLGPVDLQAWLRASRQDVGLWTPGIGWVIVGGESGGRARPMHPDWARKLRDQCEDVGIPFLFKQWGAWAPEEELRRSGLAAPPPAAVLDPGAVPLCCAAVGRRWATRTLDDRTHDAFPVEQ